MGLRSRAACVRRGLRRSRSPSSPLAGRSRAARRPAPRRRPPAALDPPGRRRGRAPVRRARLARTAPATAAPTSSPRPGHAGARRQRRAWSRSPGRSPARCTSSSPTTGGLRTSYSFLALGRGARAASTWRARRGRRHGRRRRGATTPGVLHFGLRVGDRYVDPMVLFAPDRPHQADPPRPACDEPRPVAGSTRPRSSAARSPTSLHLPQRHPRSREPRRRRPASLRRGRRRASASWRGRRRRSTRAGLGARPRSLGARRRAVRCGRRSPSGVADAGTPSALDRLARPGRASPHRLRRSDAAPAPTAPAARATSRWWSPGSTARTDPRPGADARARRRGARLPRRARSATSRTRPTAARTGRDDTTGRSRSRPRRARRRSSARCSASSPAARST